MIDSIEITERFMSVNVSNACIPLVVSRINNINSTHYKIYESLIPNNFDFILWSLENFVTMQQNKQNTAVFI